MKFTNIPEGKSLGWNFTSFLGVATISDNEGNRVQGNIVSIDETKYAELNSKFGTLFLGYNGYYGQWAFSEQGGAVLVFYTETEEGQFLVAGGMEKRILIDDISGLFTPPGGFGLNAEDTKVTAARETMEECGIHITSAKYVGGFTPNRAFWIKNIDQSWPVSVYACKVDSDLLLKDDKGYFIPNKDSDIPEMDKICKLLFVSIEEAYESGDGIAVTAFAKTFAAHARGII